MQLIIRQSTGEVVMYTDGDMTVDEDILYKVKYDPTDDELDQLARNCPAHYVDGVLEFESSVQDTIQEQRDTTDQLLAAASNTDRTVEERLDDIITLLRNSHGYPDQA